MRHGRGAVPGAVARGRGAAGAPGGAGRARGWGSVIGDLAGRGELGQLAAGKVTRGRGAGRGHTLVGAVTPSPVLVCTRCAGTVLLLPVTHPRAPRTGRRSPRAVGHVPPTRRPCSPAGTGGRARTLTWEGACVVSFSTKHLGKLRQKAGTDEAYLTFQPTPQPPCVATFQFSSSLWAHPRTPPSSLSPKLGLTPPPWRPGSQTLIQPQLFPGRGSVGGGVSPNKPKASECEGASLGERLTGSGMF